MTLTPNQVKTGVDFPYKHPAIGMGPTRTWGFWKTHLTVFKLAVANHAVNLGVLQVTLAQDPVIHTQDETNPTMGRLQAIFATSPGASTTTLGAARLQLAHQLIAAMCNVNYLGTTTAQNGLLANLIAQSVAALDGTDATLINNLAGQCDAFNNSGDLLGFPAGKSEGPADPKGAAKLATTTGPAFK